MFYAYFYTKYVFRKIMSLYKKYSVNIPKKNGTYFLITIAHLCPLSTEHFADSDKNRRKHFADSDIRCFLILYKEGIFDVKTQSCTTH